MWCVPATWVSPVSSQKWRDVWIQSAGLRCSMRLRMIRADETIVESPVTETHSSLDLVGRKTAVRSGMATFPLTRFPGSPPSDVVLTKLRTRCERSKDVAKLSLRVLDRLELLHEDVAKLEESDSLKQKFVDCIACLVKTTHQRPLLVRLANCDTVALMVYHLHVTLDEVVTGLQRVGCEVTTKWTTEWEKDREGQFSLLKEQVESASDRQLVRDLGTTQDVEIVMIQLKREMTKGGQTEDKLQLMKATFDRVSHIAGLKDQEIDVFDWFIPASDLQFDEKFGDEGTFGQVRRATWYHDGRRTEVVVKQLLAGISQSARGPFNDQMTAWFGLSEHPHILKLHGGCHIGSKLFYVCEKASQGNLATFWRSKRDPVLFWQMFIQIAEGLQFLHENDIVHGALTCSNILVGDNNTVKLSDFGFGNVRSLSAGMSVSCYKMNPQYYWQPIRENTETDDQRIESDISALGLSLLHAITQDVPCGNQNESVTMATLERGLARLRVSNVASDVWELIAQLGGNEAHTQLSLKEAIERFRQCLSEHEKGSSIATSTSSHDSTSQTVGETSTLESVFFIDSLKGSPSSRKVLKGLEVRCGRMPEIENLCRRLLQRLEFLHDRVAPLESTGLFKKKYTLVIVRFVKLMRRTPLLLRLANSEAIVWNIRGLQEILSDIQRGVGLADAPEMTEWEAQWESDQSEQYNKLEERVSRATERMLVNEVHGDKRLKEALMILRSGMNWDGLSPEMLELKSQTAERVASFANLTGLPMFQWFIAPENVEVKERIGEPGTYGEISRAIWTHDGVRTEVVVKTLLPGISTDSDEAFRRQLELWCSIPESKHVLKLYGGSHVSSPQFYVCEKATKGNLADFLKKGENNKIFWQIFFDAAQGLQFLHSQNIIHGSLKCNNILVADDYSAKFTDFGFSSIRCLCAAAGITADAYQNAVRWKPKELLEEIGNELPLFASDIYSLGMCMIEAIDHAPPFGLDGNETVMEKIMKGEMPPRPEAAADATWDVITRLCDPDYEKRPSLDEVIEEFRERAYREEEGDYALISPSDGPNEKPELPETVQDTAQESTERTDPEYGAPDVADGSKVQETVSCSYCTEASSITNSTCRCCGYVVEKNVDANSRHSLTRYFKSHPTTEAWRKIYEIAVALQDLHLQNIVHANLKPANLRVGRDGKTYLCGFEFCRLSTERTNYASCEHSCRWQAPECLAGESPSVSSDMYSLGMCIIYFVTGKPLWGTALSDKEVCKLVLDQNAVLPRPDGFTDNEWELLKKMCCYDAEKRSNIDQVICKLVKMIAGSTPTNLTWRISRDVVTFLDVPFSCSPLATRHQGRWKDAVVCIENVKERCSATSFRRVVECWLSLKFPTLLQLYGVCDEDMHQLFVCEYAASADLNAYISKHGATVEEPAIWQILLDVALAVQYLHSFGFIHGDVNHHNILVGGDGRGKLSGFFLTSKFDADHHDAPEGETIIDEKWDGPICAAGHRARFASDVYWLGRCILDAFCGQSRFTSSDDLASSRCDMCIVPKTLSRPESFCDEEWRLVSGMCCSNPSDRIEMSEVVYRLKRLAAVSRAISNKLSTVNVNFPMDRHQLQSMMMAQIRWYEEEDENGRSSECDEGEFWEEHTLGWDAFPKQYPMEKYAADAAYELIKENLNDTLRQYEPNETPPPVPLNALNMSDCSQFQRTPFQWLVPDDNVVANKSSEVIGAGAFASVCSGAWFGASVALKKMTKVKGLPNSVVQTQALHEEANIWFHLRHPHIVSLYGAFTRGCCLFICDLVNNGRLDKCHQNKDSKEKIWGFLYDAAIGLQGLHLQGIVHADLKCNNILIGADGRAKLIDFGLSCLHTCDGGKPLGALRWKAPECLEGAGPTFESDIYSFGMCIVEAVTGSYPWRRKLYESAITYFVKKGQLPHQPADFSQVQWELVKRMCSLEPSHRLKIDDVVRVVGFFADRLPYVEDANLRNDFTWLFDPTATGQA